MTAMMIPAAATIGIIDARLNDAHTLFSSASRVALPLVPRA